MIQTVPISNLVAMGITLLIAMCMPMGLCLYYRCKCKAKISSFFIGCVIFVVSALFLEQLLHMVVLYSLGDISEAIKNNIWLTGIYGGLAAGIFEETGRLFAMKAFFKDERTKENALMYGAGHGGIEAIILVGLTSFSNMLTAISINNGSLQTAMDQGLVKSEVIEQIAPLWEYSSIEFLLGGFERVLAMILHLALSVLIFSCIRQKKWQYYGLAVAIHAAIDFVAVVVNNYFPTIVTELVIAAAVAGTVVFAYRIYQKEN